MSNENNELFKRQAKLLDRIKDAVGLSVGTSGFKRYTTGTYTNLTWHSLVDGCCELNEIRILT